MIRNCWKNHDLEPVVVSRWIGPHEPVQVHRLLACSCSPRPGSTLDVALVGRGGQHDDRDRSASPCVALDLGEHLAAVGAGQVEVEQDDARPRGASASAYPAAVAEVVERVVAVLAAADRVGRAPPSGGRGTVASKSSGLSSTSSIGGAAGPMSFSLPGQGEEERRALARRGLDPDAPAVALDDLS